MKMNITTNTNATNSSSPASRPGEIAGPAHTAAAAGQNRVETTESSDTAQAAEIGHEPERIPAQPAGHHPGIENHEQPGTALEPVTRSSEPASPSSLELKSPQNRPDQPELNGTSTKDRATITSTAPLENPPKASGGLTAPPMVSLERDGLTALSGIRESNAALSRLLEDLAHETRQAAAAHGDSLRAIHGAMQELRRAHQEISSRLNQPQGQ